MSKELAQLVESHEGDPDDSVRIKIKSTGEEKLLTGLTLLEYDTGTGNPVPVDGKIDIIFSYFSGEK